MALENVEVLGNLQNQLNQVEEQLNALTNTRFRLLGAIEVLQQIENSKAEEALAATKSEGDVGESSSVDGKSSKGTDSSNSDS